MNCRWCGDSHGVDRMCAKAQRGMNRRSFCFLFGAGVAGSMLPSMPLASAAGEDLVLSAHWIAPYLDIGDVIVIGRGHELERRLVTLTSVELKPNGDTKWFLKTVPTNDQRFEKAWVNLDYDGSQVSGLTRSGLTQRLGLVGGTHR